MNVNILQVAHYDNRQIQNASFKAQMLQIDP